MPRVKALSVRGQEPISQRSAPDRAVPDASFLHGLAPVEMRCLRAMAELGPGPHRSGDIAHRLGTKVQSVAPVRAALIAKGMVYSPSHGDTGFTVPLFDQYMRRAMPNPT